MHRLVLAVVLASGFSLIAAEPSEDPAVVLAEILSQKGAITSSDLARVKSADDHSRIAVLASILQEKGVLNETDVARLSVPNGSAAQSVQAVLPSTPSSSAKVQTTDIPVVTKKGLPISLYGTVLFTAGSNTAVFNYSDVAMIASKQGTDATGADKNFYASGRQTRLGLNVDPVSALGGKLTGRFEFDMMGGGAPYPNGINMNLFRMRLAYGRVDWDRAAVEAGQDWSIFAPLSPTSLNEYGIPEFTGAGNLWIRLPQLRLENEDEEGGREQSSLAAGLVGPEYGRLFDNCDFGCAHSRYRRAGPCAVGPEQISLDRQARRSGLHAGR